MLIRRGADVLAKNNNYHSILHVAVLNVKSLNLIINEIINKLDGEPEQMVSALNTIDNNGDTLLMWATKDGSSAKIIKILLDLKETDINHQNYFGASALHWAAEYGHIHIVETLLACNALPNIKNETNVSPFQVALDFAHFEVVKMLLENGADVLAKSNYNSVLHLSVNNDDIFETILDKILKQLDKDEYQLRQVLNAPDDVGNTPLMWAVSEGNAFVTQVFLTCNHIDINKQNLKGWTALLGSAELGLCDITELLIKHGADVFVKNGDKNETVLHQAVKNIDVLKLVITDFQKKCDGNADHLRSVMNAPDTKGDTPLMWTAENGYSNCTELLLECDEIDINKQNLNGWTALHWAAYKGHLELVNLLIDKIVDVNIKDKNDQQHLICH